MTKNINRATEKDGEKNIVININKHDKESQKILRKQLQGIMWGKKLKRQKNIKKNKKTRVKNVKKEKVKNVKKGNRKCEEKTKRVKNMKKKRKEKV